MPIDIALTNEQQVRVRSVPVTAAGNPASVDGPLRISVVSGDATVEQDPGAPLEAVLVSSDAPGDTTFLVEADADLGEGVVLIQDTVTLRVAGAQAAALGLSADAPEPK